MKSLVVLCLVMGGNLASRDNVEAIGRERRKKNGITIGLRNFLSALPRELPLGLLIGNSYMDGPYPTREREEHHIPEDDGPEEEGDTEYFVKEDEEEDEENNKEIEN